MSILVRAGVACLLVLITNSPQAQSPDAEQEFFNEGAKETRRQRTRRAQRRYLVDVGARLILPRLDRQIDASGERAEVYVQFTEPPRAEERGRLKQTGVRFYGAIAGSTYLVRVKPQGLAALRAHPLILGIEPVLPEDKLTEALYRGTVGPHVVNPDGTWSVYVRFYEGEKLTQALDALDARGVRVPERGEFLFGERLLVHATWEQVLSLAEDQTIRSIAEVPLPPKPDNTTAQTVSNVDDVQAAPFNLNGGGVVMGIWDNGEVLATHADLTPRVTLVEMSLPEDHSTHVAGTMLSSGVNNVNAEGMAPAAGQLFSFNFQGDTATEQNNSVLNNGIVIANHSWGSVIGWNFQGNPGMWVQTGNQNQFGLYDQTASDWDNLVQTRALSVVKSSGNDRNDCNPIPPGDCDGITGTGGVVQYDTVGTHGNAKNIITVGAVNDDGTTITGFSSTGPADDGRFKPDVVANGLGLLSTWAGNVGATGDDTAGCGGAAYCSISGTSMSTPTVSGTVALLVERYRNQIGGTPSPDIIKALLVNTARDLGQPGPDYIYGHGLVDALAAVNTIDVGEVRILTGAVDNGDVDEFLLAVPSGLPALRLALNWIDPEGVANNVSPDIVNDLDVRAVAPNGTVFFPFTGPGTGAANVVNNATATGANTVDTVENLRVATPQQGFWRIQVRGTNVPAGPQNYALVANASFSLATQPDIRVNAPLDFDETCAGDFQDIQVSIFNVGGVDLRVHSVAVIAGAADFSVLPNPTQPFLVAPGAHVDVTVRFQPTTPGPKTGTLEIRSNDPDQGVLTVAMTGQGGSGDVNATLEADGEFGNVAAGSFGVLTLQVLNQGTCNLAITSIMRTMGSADFTVGAIPGAGFPQFPLVLSHDAHVDIPIRFEPTAFGLQSAVFRLQTDDLDESIIDVPVTGTSPASDIRVSGSTEFGIVCPEERAEKVLDICNVGLSDLVVSSVAFDPPCANFALVRNPFPANVSHDFCLPVTIRYTPTGVGTHMCTLVIATNDPDMPMVSVGVTGTTPVPSIDVPPNLGFLPEVLQSVGTCESRQPFPVSNTGRCLLEITNVALGAPAPGDYALSGLPSFPILLEAGHVVGEGDLGVVFRPTVLARAREATLAVTWRSDPIVGTTQITTRNLCGEGVFTGARVLVTAGGAPLAQVERIQLHRVNANRNRKRLDTVDTVHDVLVKSQTPPAPCPSFQYHTEYGTVDNPVQLLPGAYQVTVAATVNGRKRQKTVGFDVTTCDFNPTVVVPF